MSLYKDNKMFYKILVLYISQHFNPTISFNLLLPHLGLAKVGRRPPHLFSLFSALLTSCSLLQHDFGVTIRKLFHF